MQPSTDKAPPISVLHEDLLFNIFFENTYLDFDNFESSFDTFFFRERIPDGGTEALITAQHCSLVSRQWRSIYLSSPSIWGRLISVDDLKRKTENWRNEVMARTGEASLWVYGHLRDDETLHFVFPFLEQNWARVQMLFLIDNNPLEATQTRLTLADGQKRWAFLKEPAPQLQRICITMSSPMDEAYLPPARTLFSNNAPPLLRHFAVSDRIPQILSRRNLSSLSLSSKIPTEEFLKMLQEMPELLSLKISGDLISKPNQEACARVILPKLRMLFFGGGVSFLTAGTILQSITPSSDCCLCAPLESERLLDSGEYKQYETGLATFVLPYLSLHPPLSAVTLTLRNSCVVLQSGPAFVITFSARPPSVSSPAPLLKVLICSGAFSNVSTVRVENTWSTSPQDFIHIFPEAFPSATTLIATDDIIQTLLQLDRNRMSTLLPSLVTLEVRNGTYSPGDHGVKESPHEQFLKLRKDLGLPLSVLNLGFIVNNFPVDLDYFELEHPGLLVKWSLKFVSEFKGNSNFEEYRCGDGHPERLRFASLIMELREEPENMLFGVYIDWNYY
ncbi:hypothetical protein D9613_010852 [Agrocybe pediades]|uniref:F-box domain-containing protein n=1 Tax=Agrocybe pediades TaxID=84607 RepID=A0A8H4VKT6_9AGAR|nr:hypothetical protein D9613_010852 [Agrocybe pediades]